MITPITDSAFAGSTILLNTRLAAGRTLSSTWFTTHKPSKTRSVTHLQQMSSTLTNKPKKLTKPQITRHHQQKHQNKDTKNGH